MRERLRSARRAMHARFPFSEALWLEWLDDELPGAREPDARAQAEALLDTAVQDYLSVPVWARYLRCVRSPPPPAPALRPRSLRCAGCGSVPRSGPHEAPPVRCPAACPLCALRLRVPPSLAARARQGWVRARAGCARRQARA